MFTAGGEKEGANGKDEGVQATKDEIPVEKEGKQVPEEKAAAEKTKKKKKKGGGKRQRLHKQKVCSRVRIFNGVPLFVMSLTNALDITELAVPPSHIVEVSPKEDMTETQDVPEPTTQDPLYKDEGGEIILFTAAKQYIAEVCSSNTQQLDDLKKKINEGAVQARSVGTQKQWQILANELSSLSQRSAKTDKKITEAIKTLDQLIKDLKGINSDIESLAVKSDEFDSENSSLKRQKHEGDMQHKLSSLISSTLSAGRASSISSNNAPEKRKVSAESSKAGMAPKRVEED
ncbi:hypothetical protein D9613_003358 [Agrocybe pediades]|uniref:Uncharacterized protein n=1 Tax=Agrocybe pediades TaxID=84607 RepID=A0A8H4QRE1_9AGAR|nr:hypothetical protein D9613_003358 [Agrocybe pediades]